MPGFGTFFESSLVLSFQVCHSLVVHLAFFKVFWAHYSYQHSGIFFLVLLLQQLKATTAVGNVKCHQDINKGPEQKNLTIGV